MSDRMIYMTISLGIPIPDSTPEEPKDYDEYDNWYNTHVEPIIVNFNNNLGKMVEYFEVHDVETG